MGRLAKISGGEERRPVRTTPAFAQARAFSRKLAAPSPRNLSGGKPASRERLTIDGIRLRQIPGTKIMCVVLCHFINQPFTALHITDALFDSKD